MHKQLTNQTQLKHHHGILHTSQLCILQSYADYNTAFTYQRPNKSTPLIKCHTVWSRFLPKTTTTKIWTTSKMESFRCLETSLPTTYGRVDKLLWGAHEKTSIEGVHNLLCTRRLLCSWWIHSTSIMHNTATYMYLVACCQPALVNQLLSAYANQNDRKKPVRSYMWEPC